MKARGGRRQPELPPGPDLPPARQTARFAMRPLGFLEEQRARFGDVFTVRALDDSPWVMVSDPAAIGEVFKAPAATLHAGEAKGGVLAPLLGDNSLLLLDEERHMEQRRLLMPPFGADRVARYGERMRTAAESAVERWPPGREEPAAPWTRAIALEVMLWAVFGVGHSERLSPLREALSELRIPGNAREGWTLAYRARVAHIDKLVYAEIGERRGRSEAGEDVLSLLLGARHEDGAPMSNTEIRDELMTLLMAGYETTATTLAWALERLARNPEALRRTTAEAGEGGGAYTDAVLRETLRLRPALPTVARTVKAPFELGGWLLPSGAMIRVAVLLVHHRPDVYPEPTAFRPERFLGSPPDPHTWLPFGGGVRRCIGARFAMEEMRIVLAALLRRFEPTAAGSAPEAMRHRDITLTPARGAPMTLRQR